MDFEQRLIVALNKALFTLKQESPYDTGNLRYNAIKLASLGNGHWQLYVDEAVAPYMVYTNEPWEQKWINMGNFKKGQTVQRLRTWKNPNEGWFDTAIQKVLQQLRIELGGTLKEISNDNN